MSILTKHVLLSSQTLSNNSKKISISADRKYVISTKIKAKKGIPYSAYFGVVIFGKNITELNRKIQWLNDFSDLEKTVNMNFVAPPESDYIVIIYRINVETPVRSNCEYWLLPIENVTISESNSEFFQENYKEPNDYILPKSRELSEEEENILEQNLVWIFASPRSGTSWLGGELLSHHTLFLNEPLIGQHLGIVRTVGDKSIHVRGVDLNKNEPNYFFSDNYKKTWQFYLRKLILNRIYSQFEDLSKPIIIKEPNGSMAADILSEILPKSRIIIMLRDGRDVVDSKLDSLREGSWASEKNVFTYVTEKNRTSEIIRIAQQWNKMVTILISTYENHNKDLRLLIKYEELRENTFKELKKIYEFIKIPIEDSILAVMVEKYKFENIPQALKGPGKVRRSATPGKWKENFSESEQIVLNKIMNKTLLKIGHKI